LQKNPGLRTNIDYCDSLDGSILTENGRGYRQKVQVVCRPSVDRPWLFMFKLLRGLIAVREKTIAFAVAAVE
jgi:hypothetical protein